MMIFMLASSLFLSTVQQGQAMHGKRGLCNCNPFLHRQSECSQRAVICLYIIQGKCWPSSTKKNHCQTNRFYQKTIRFRQKYLRFWMKSWRFAPKLLLPFTVFTSLRPSEFLSSSRKPKQMRGKNDNTDQAPSVYFSLASYFREDLLQLHFTNEHQSGW